MKSATLTIITSLMLIAVSAGAAFADDQKTVADLDTQYQAAVKANDATTMDRILADDFVLVEGDGTVSTKADLLNEAKRKRIIYKHQEELESSVNGLTKVLNPGQRHSCSSTPEQLGSASAFSLNTLQPCRRGLIGKLIAPLVTAGAKEFAPNRVIELADSIQREREGTR